MVLVRIRNTYRPEPAPASPRPTLAARRSVASLRSGRSQTGWRRRGGLRASGRPVRAIVVTTPAGFGDFVMAAGIPASDGVSPGPAPEQLVATAARFGIRLPA